MGECNCGPELTTVLLIALGLVAGAIGTAIVVASLGTNIVRMVRFLRTNTVRLFVSVPREPKRAKSPRERPGIWAALWATLLFAVLIGVIVVSLVTIGTAS